MTGHVGHAVEARLAQISVVLALATLSPLVLIDQHLRNDIRRTALHAPGDFKGVHGVDDGVAGLTSN